jgi:hypothetical protein
MIGRCAGGHRKSRRTAGAIHRRNICGRLQLRGSFAATDTGEVVLIGTHGGELVIASGRDTLATETFEGGEIKLVMI